MTQTGGARMTNRVKQPFGAIAMLAAIGGLIGFPSGSPSTPEAIAAAEGAAPAHQPNPAWVAPSGPGGRQKTVSRDCPLC